MSRPLKVEWRLHDDSVPLQQGDLLLVAWAKMIEPQMESSSTGYPVIGRRDAFSLRFWDASHPPLLEMWGCLDYGLAVVVADDCAIDKEFNMLREIYLGAGLDAAVSAEQAHERAEPYVTVAEVWPVEVLPDHLRQDAESGAMGYLPFSMVELVPQEARPYVVDLNRMATVSWRAIDRRLAMREERWRQRLQTQLCRFFAARTIRVNDELAELFSRPVVRAEALTPQSGNPARTRARLHFADGSTAIIEAIVSGREVSEQGSARPGLHTRE